MATRVPSPEAYLGLADNGETNNGQIQPINNYYTIPAQVNDTSSEIAQIKFLIIGIVLGLALGMAVYGMMRDK